jgi:hypothetical protein
MAVMRGASGAKALFSWRFGFAAEAAIDKASL